MDVPGAPFYGEGPKWEEGRLFPFFPHRQEKEAWIHAKYVEKKFLTKLPEIRGRRGGRGPPRVQPPVPPKPSIRPQPGGVRSKPGIELFEHVLSICCVLALCQAL